MTFSESKSGMLRAALGATALTLVAGAASADQVFLDDVIISGGSLCVGFDCVNGESFGFDTLRLKENNLRIHFQDTSTSASFPTRDWRIGVNDTSNGGANKFFVEDSDAGTQPFIIEASAGNHALYLDDGGRLGLGTNSPVVDLHVKTGNTPTLRLEQDGSSGFTPQTWDVAGNETNFFVRDATNGSTLSFRIKPGSATANAIFVDSDGDVGMGTPSPDAHLDIENSGTFAFLRLTAASASPNIAGDITFTDAGDEGEFRFNIVDGDAEEMRLDHLGNLQIDGTLTVNFESTGETFPDYVFAPDYELMPLYDVEKFVIENRHLPRIPSASEVGKNGLNMTELQVALLEKVEELTLHAIAQQKTIDALQERLEALAD